MPQPLMQPQPSMQPHPSCAMGSAPLGFCVTIQCLEPFSSGSSLGVGWPGVSCPASPLFHSSVGNGQAAPGCRPVLFEALSCRAGPARKKPVS